MSDDKKEKDKDTHSWFTVTGAVSICVKCSIIRRFCKAGDSSLLFSEYIRLTQSEAKLYHRAGVCGER